MPPVPPVPPVPGVVPGVVVPPGGVVVLSGVVVVPGVVPPGVVGVVVSAGGVAGVVMVSAGGMAGAGLVAAGELAVPVSSRLLQPASSAHTIALQKTILLVVVSGAVMIFPFG